MDVGLNLKKLKKAQFLKLDFSINKLNVLGGLIRSKNLYKE